MRISSWMTPNPISVTTATSLSKCQRLLKTHSIHRLPVVDSENNVIGIISDRDVKSASPSKATSLEVHEMQYIIAQITAKDIMTANPITVFVDDTVSKAALLMLEHCIGGLPVLDKNNKLAGIITDQDIFKVLVSIGGARVDGIEITVEAVDEKGALGNLFTLLREHGARVVSVMTHYLDNNSRQVFLRIRSYENPEQEENLRQALMKTINLVEWTHTSK